MTRLSEAEARGLLREWTVNPSLLQHARAVELAMRSAAFRYGAGDLDELEWGLAGLLHDADYDRWPEEHPRRIIAWLRERGEETIAHAVQCHFEVDEPPANTMDRAILACDELAGFVVACCLVRPDGISTLTPSSVKKKLKDKAFAAKVDRGVIKLGVERLGAEMDAHIQMVIDALKPHAVELGIAGRGGVEG
jgi:predicted hydrolase (HD superfamily)